MKTAFCSATTLKVLDEHIRDRRKILGSNIVHQFMNDQSHGSRDLKHFLGLHSPFINWLKSLSLFIHYEDNQDLILESLTHTSFKHENKDWPIGDNERLEFLGDAVLDQEISQRLFKKYPEYNEGQLSRLRSSLVNEDVLAAWACLLGIDQFVMLGKGEAGKERVGSAILADAFEAMIGALYLIDSELPKKILDSWIDIFDEKSSDGKPFFCPSRLEDFDPKTRLQEICLENFKEVARYETVLKEERGQEMIFSSSAFCADSFLGSGEGSSKKRAQSAAAKIALKSNELKELIKLKKEKTR